MANTSWDSIIDIIKPLVGQVWDRRNDKTFWSGDLSDGKTGALTVTGVSLEPSGLSVTVDDESGTSYALKAVPADLSHTHVFLNGNLDEEAALVFAPKVSPGNPMRFAFDFRPVDIGNGVKVRFNLRYDP